MSAQIKTIPSGPAAAAMIGAGIGSLAIGILTTAAEASEALKNSLNLYNPVGPLSGKTLGGMAVWLIAWLILHAIWKDKEINLRSAFTWALVLIGLGVLLTFPPFFVLFEA